MTQQESIYVQAVELAKSRRAIDIKRAMDLFESIPDYKDASSCAQACRERLEHLKNYENHKQAVYSTKRYLELFCVVFFWVCFCVIGCIILFSVLNGEKTPVHTVKPIITPVNTDSMSMLTPEETATPTLVTTILPTTGTSVSVSVPTPTETPTETLTETPTLTPTSTATPSDVKVGETVAFGSYEQDNDTSNGAEPIEWIILGEQDGKTLLLSKYALDAQPFHSAPYDSMDFIFWDACTLRTWLNTTFFERAFSESGQGKIHLSDINTAIHAGGSFDTEDRIFLLSYEEAGQLRYTFLEENILSVEATDYAYAQIETSVYSWWLRTNGMGWDSTHSVSENGSIRYDGGVSHRTTLLVRPAMWVTLDNGGNL